MKKPNTFILFLSVLALCSCKGTDDGENTKPESIVMNQISAASLSATVSCTFNDLSDKDLMYGHVVVLYSDADNASDQFASWQNGNENPSCQVYKKGSIKSGGGFEAKLSGLQPDTKYNCCIGFASEDGSRRETSGTMTFVTLPFKPEITTGAAANIRYFDAILNGSVSFASDADAEVCSTGLLVSAKQDAAVSEGTLLPVTQGDKLQFALTAAKLDPDTQYYYRAFASHKDADGKDSYTFGQERDFTTKSLDEMAVDLGLSVKWANCDLGDQEYNSDIELQSIGYCWGYTYDLHGRNWFYNGKYPNPVEYKYGDKDLGPCISGTEYDAATAILGGKWRMPTLEEAQELSTCITKAERKTLDDGDSDLICFTLTGKNGNKISFNASMINMDYWTGTQNEKGLPYYMRYQPSENQLVVITGIYDTKVMERPIRPVCDY